MHWIYFMERLRIRPETGTNGRRKPKGFMPIQLGKRALRTILAAVPRQFLTALRSLGACASLFLSWTRSSWDDGYKLLTLTGRILCVLLTPTSLPWLNRPRNIQFAKKAPLARCSLTKRAMTNKRQNSLMVCTRSHSTTFVLGLTMIPFRLSHCGKALVPTPFPTLTRARKI